MGFETKYNRVLVWNLAQFEVSLWDLKHEKEAREAIYAEHLKYPYGIWN